MTSAKQRFRVVAGRPVSIPDDAPQRESAVEAARRRHGKDFAADRASGWKPGVGIYDDEPFLTRWLRARKGGG
jgi:hypothetical protein